MNTLTQLQQGFQHQVLSGNADYAAVSGHMEIYTKAYQARLNHALMDNYPVLHRALGDDAFAELAGAYARARPSHHRSIRWWGDDLVDFIAAHADAIPHPALLDIARMDWAMRGAFDAADAVCLVAADLARVAPADWAALRLHTMPSLRLIGLQWGVEALWHALHADANAQTSAPAQAVHTMMVWRYQLECRWRSLQPVEHMALGLLQQGACFADLCEALQQAGDAAPAYTAAELLKTWVAEGILARP